jgi:hypothetical protein
MEEYWTHGTRLAYRQRKCRCLKCRAWQANDTLRLRLRRRGRLAPDDPRHGQRSTYNNWMCRCERCSTAKAIYMKERYPRR